MPDWYTNLQSAQTTASIARPILVDFVKDGCVGCAAMDRDSWGDTAIEAFVAETCVPLRVTLQNRAHQPLFREHHVIWTPTVAVLDHRGALHYHTPGYLPPDQLTDVLRIGVARALTAWMRYDQAAAQLATVADTPGAPLAAEALFWLGAVRYLQHRTDAPMLEHWQRLVREHPQSLWAARVPPQQR